MRRARAHHDTDAAGKLNGHSAGIVQRGVDGTWGETGDGHTVRTELAALPNYLGFLMAFWCTPNMSAGHLLFATAMTAFVLIGIHYEERDLVRQFGEQYVRYRAQVGMLVPLPRGKENCRNEMPTT